ncbi:MAG: cytochrome C oxidase subunit IV family protein [Planctomycetales bacterium]
MADEHGNSHKVNYTGIFILLCVCTALSVAADLTKNSLGVRIMIGLVMGIALVKASFVLLYFMHIKFEGAWKYVLLAPTMVLALTIPLALSPDVGFHYYLMQVPQTLTPLPKHDGAGHGAAHGAAASHGDAHAAPAKPAPAKSH